MALREEMRRDPDVILLGEDIATFGGAFKITRGFLEEFGAERVIDTPISESGFVGAACGAAIEGLRPGRRVPVRRLHRVRVRSDRQLRGQGVLPLGHAGAGRVSRPVGRRVPRRPVPFAESGGVVHARAGPEGRAAVDAVRRQRACSRRRSATTTRSSTSSTSTSIAAFARTLPEDDFIVPLGVADIKREGRDLTMVTYGAMVHECLAVADRLSKEGAAVRGDRPPHAVSARQGRLSRPACARRRARSSCTKRTSPAGSAAKWRRSSRRRRSTSLDAPVTRVASLDVPVPFAGPLEDAVLPERRQDLPAAVDVLEY